MKYLGTGEKLCPKCEQVLPIDRFTVKNADTGQVYSWCRGCTYNATNDWRKRQPKERFTQYGWKTRMGVTWETAEKMLIAQDYKCASCGDDIIEQFNLDHDHATGKPRAFLCSACNWMLGHAKDSPERLRLGALYLEEWQ
jgi:hypothetical protein